MPFPTSDHGAPEPSGQDGRPGRPGRLGRGATQDVLYLQDVQAVEDLERFSTRARALADTGMRFQVHRGVLAAWVSGLQPRGLGDQVPVAIGLRTMALAAGPDGDDPSRLDGLDAVFSLSAVLERLARLRSSGSTAFTLPPVQEQVTWTAVTPPRGGWAPVATVHDDELQQVAQEGIRELAQALPADPGAAMVAQARGAIWGRMLGGAGEQDGFLPAGAAFAAHGLGFLVRDGSTAVHTTGPWVRLSNPAGFVLCRAAPAL